jgi:predicted transcriptional regulator
MRRDEHDPDEAFADVTETELAILKALWRRGAATIRELTDELYPAGGTSHYATVQKLLERLEGKGHVSREPRGRANLYRATVGRGELISRRLQATADSLCEGSLTPLLTHLVGAARLTPEDLSALRELVDAAAPAADGARDEEGAVS